MAPVAAEPMVTDPPAQPAPAAPVLSPEEQAIQGPQR